MDRILFPKRPVGAPPPIAVKLFQEKPDLFQTADEARRYLQLIYFPLSRKWRYQLNGKSGNTFVLNMLFEMEFGTRFTSRLENNDNQHPDFALFMLPEARLLSNAIFSDDSLSTFFEFPGLSLATVRNPFDRAISGYLYVCRSHQIGDRRFLAERLKLNAQVGFDWDTDPGTSRGFGKFLKYLQICVETEGPGSLDPHWMPQILHIRPDVYKPNLIGRTENLQLFAANLAERLDIKIPDLSSLKTNETKSHSVSSSFYKEIEYKRIIEDIYHDDFQYFNY